MKRRWIGTIGLGCALLAGCAGDHRVPVDPEQAMQSLRAGQTLLQCREPCLADWRIAEPKAQSLVAASHWRDLVVLLAGVGYQDDLTLYYLGEAAQGLGFPAAAAGYYRQSIELSVSDAACYRLSRQCGGVGLPRAARARLATLDRPAAQPRRAPASPPARGIAPASLAPRGSTAPAAAPEAPPPAGVVVAAPAAEPPALLPPTSLLPPPLPRETAAPKPGEDYIEPPAAAR